MMKVLSQVLFILLAALMFVTPVLAEEATQPIQSAKVYRDYPGYMTPPTCEIPECETADKSLLGGRFYLSGWGGLSGQSSDTLDFQTFKYDVDYKNGYALGAAAGYDFGPARLEVEYSYRNNDINKLEIMNVEVNDSGNMEIEAFMINGYYDFNTYDIATPYLVIGGGWADVTMDGVKANGVTIVDDDDNVWAAQIGAGVQVAINKHLAVDIGYRFFVTDDPEFKAPDGTKVETDVKNHVGMIGLTFKF
jgi:opacity protein-like surface antigen